MPIPYGHLLWQVSCFEKAIALGNKDAEKHYSMYKEELAKYKERGPSPEFFWLHMNVKSDNGESGGRDRQGRRTYPQRAAAFPARLSVSDKLCNGRFRVRPSAGRGNACTVADP